jgi:hypothetical protein
MWISSWISSAEHSAPELIDDTSKIQNAGNMHMNSPALSQRQCLSFSAREEGSEGSFFPNVCSSRDGSHLGSIEVPVPVPAAVLYLRLIIIS